MTSRSSSDWEQTKTTPGRIWAIHERARTVPGLTVLAHPDPERVGERAFLPELLDGGTVPLSRLEPSFTSPYGGPTRPLADPYLSRRPIVLCRDGDRLCIDCTTTGTRVTVSRTTIATQKSYPFEAIEDGIVLLLAESVALLLHNLKEDIGQAWRSSLVGESPAMVQLREEIRRVADLSVPVLLRGETGTGKELVAREIHAAGPRRDKPYLGVNMGAIPTTLAAAELFGAARGAFTGAERRRLGYFQRADGGTLLLDEIGATPTEIQVMLLRVLETNMVELVGEQTAQEVDVRILAATDADLDDAIQQGDFKAPLLHRLSSYEIQVPPLRERREDFGRLFYHFLRAELEATGEPHRFDRPKRGTRPWLPASLVARMAELNWPGNVRQLRNVARQLVIASRGSTEVRLTSQIEHLLSDAAASEAVEREEPRSPKQTYRDPREVKEEELVAALRANHWRLKPTAKYLGVSRTSLYALVDRCPQVRKAKDITRQEVEKALERADGHLDRMSAELEVSRDALLRRMRELGLR